MNTIELPSRDEILKHVKPGHAMPVQIVKNGTPVPNAAAGSGDKLSPPRGKSFAQWVDITPEMAAKWLKNNLGNRTVSLDVVKAYARDMLNGQWGATHQGLAFDDEDRLIDGQHRLQAIVLANITVQMMVTFGLPAKIQGREMTTMDCVDRGRTRSVADQLKIQHGFKYGSLMASICAALASVCLGERTRRLSVGQTLEVYREFEPAMKFVIENRSKQVGLRSAGVAAAFVFASEARDGTRDLKAEVQAMFLALNSSDLTTGKYPVIALLRAFLTSDEAKLISRSLDRGLAEMTLQVLYLEIHGRQVEKLEMSLEGADWFRAQQKARVEKVAAIFELPSSQPQGEDGGSRMEDGGKTAMPATAQQAGTSCPRPVQKSRPSLDVLLSKVEGPFGISRFIITGRGRDQEIDSARKVFVHLARSVGHTEEAVAQILKRDVDQVRELNVPAEAMNAKQRKVVAVIKATL